MSTVIVDVHAHVTPPEYLVLSKQLGGSFEDRFTGHPDPVTLLERLALMEEAGVARQILSPTCAPYSHAPAAAAVGARLINEHYARIVSDYPERFGFWVSLPLPDVDAALQEIEYGMDVLAGKGIVLGCFCLGESIADSRFDPVYAELNRRSARVFLHPCQNGLCSPHLNDWGLTVCAGASFEDSVAAMHLIVRQVPIRYPALRFIVPHFGGILPNLLNRLDGQMPKRGLAELPSVTARRFFYDTVGWGSRAALIAAVEAFGAPQIVTGSDFPILLGHESYKQTFDHIRDCDLSGDIRKTILETGARLMEVSV